MKKSAIIKRHEYRLNHQKTGENQTEAGVFLCFFI